MIASRHKPFWIWFIRIYTAVNLKLSFSKVTVEWDGLAPPPPGRAVLLIGNHFSWWDGFFAYYLNYSIFRRKFHVMMLEEQLAVRMFLNKAGAYSIKRGSRTVIDSLRYTASLLSGRDNLVVLFPQGQIQSQYRYPVKFERGIERIINSAEYDYPIIFYVAAVDWFSSKKPVLTFRLSEFVPERPVTHAAVEQAFNTHLEASLNKQIPPQP
jgi:1-acyl-sn-glycerol-3-phosphate acyltransferase